MSTLVKTFSFATDAESFVASNQGQATLTYSSGSGNPAGSLFYDNDGNGFSSPNALWTWTGTYEDLGIPASSTITDITTTSADVQCPVAVKIITAAVNSVTMTNPILTLSPGRSWAASDATWYPDTGSNATGLSIASNSTVTIVVDSTLINQSNPQGDIQIYVDNIQFTITYDGPTVYQGTASVTGTGSLNATGTLLERFEATATFDSTSSLVGNANTNVIGTVSFDGISTLNAIGVHSGNEIIHQGTADFSGISNFIGTGAKPVTQATRLGLSGTPRKVVTILGTGGGVVTYPGSADFTGTGDLSAIGDELLTYQAIASFDSTGTLSASANHINSATADFNGIGDLSSSANTNIIATADFTGISTLFGNGQKIGSYTGTASFSGTGAFDSNAITQYQSSASFNGIGLFEGIANRIHLAVASFDSTSSLSSHANLINNATASFKATSA